MAPKRIILISAVFLLVTLSVPKGPASAQTQDEATEEFYRARVVEVMEEKEEEAAPGYIERTQRVRLEFLSGPEDGTEREIEHGSIFALDKTRMVKAGQTVVVAKSIIGGEIAYHIIDTYRLTPLIAILGLFFLLAIIFGRLKGFTSIIGLAFTILVLAAFIVPRIIAGSDPFWTSLIGAFVIAVASLYLAHGFSKRTSVALLSTVVTLTASAGLAILFVSWARLFGLGSEQAFYLSYGELEHINLRGLLLGGIIIGSLGVLDDITTSQTAAIAEISDANQKFSRKELYHRGLRVGREHIASLINTLVLAYAGVGMPLFLLFSAYRTQPYWVIFNSEMIAEEIVRTLVGSAALILAVPIATAFAAYFLKTKNA